ncbi:unnamed protein product, partial [Discosporangium mesarthrocarpum]
GGDGSRGGTCDRHFSCCTELMEGLLRALLAAGRASPGYSSDTVATRRCAVAGIDELCRLACHSRRGVGSRGSSTEAEGDRGEQQREGFPRKNGIDSGKEVVAGGAGGPWVSTLHRGLLAKACGAAAATLLGATGRLPPVGLLSCFEGALGALGREGWPQARALQLPGYLQRGTGKGTGAGAEGVGEGESLLLPTPGGENREEIMFSRENGTRGFNSAIEKLKADVLAFLAIQALYIRFVSGPGGQHPAGLFEMPQPLSWASGPPSRTPTHRALPSHSTSSTWGNGGEPGEDVVDEEEQGGPLFPSSSRWTGGEAEPPPEGVGHRSYTGGSMPLSGRRCVACSLPVGWPRQASTPATLLSS